MARQILLLGLILLVLIPVCAETEKIESSLKSIQGIYINAESVFAPDGATLSYGNTYTLEEGDTQTVFGTTVEVEVISDDCEVRIEINGDYLTERRLEEGNNVIEFNLRDAKLQKSRNFLKLKFKYHLPFRSAILWKTSALMDKIEVD